VKGNAAHNRDYWPYYDLETKTAYTTLLAGVKFDPPAYTSKSCCRCGAIGAMRRLERLTWTITPLELSAREWGWPARQSFMLWQAECRAPPWV